MPSPKLFPVPALRRRAIWGFVLAQLPQALNIAIMFLGLTYPVLKVPLVVHMWALGVMIVLSMAITIWLGVTNHRIAREAMARNGAVCIHCLYHLPIEDAKGNCPECGHSFSHESNRLAWGLRSRSFGIERPEAE
jgi:hypothetical protein